MKKNVFKIVVIIAVAFGMNSYFSHNERASKSHSYKENGSPKKELKLVNNEYAVDMLSSAVVENAPILQIQESSNVKEDLKDAEGIRTFKAGGMGKFDNKKRESLVLRNLASAQLKLKKDELRIIDEEIKYDEMRLEELIQKGDEQNVAYLEDVIAQKKARISELQ